MVFAAEYPFLNILGSMILFFSWVIWIWMMIAILSDVFRRSDLTGGAKAAWTVFLIVLPFIGALIYLSKHHGGMTERNVKQARVQQAAFDEHIKSVATNGHGGVAAEIDKAKGLLDSGTINQSEFDALKAKALA
jgi:hypothetical protein